ncbi:MAG: TlpA family protein disulfide reductase [Proteobacteria bacterium]|nr:TlpA family protein disulfide reductase [Pseudomonadota bacterium]
MVAAALLLLAGRTCAADLGPWTEASPPTFTLPAFGTSHERSVALAQQTGDAVLVHFFASWCEPCRDELPALERLARRGGPGVKVVAIAVADIDAPLRRLIDAAGATFPVLMDRDRAVARAWSISTLPSTVVLNAKREPRLIAEGDVAWDTVDPKQLIEHLSSAHRNAHTQQSLVIQGGSQNVP